MLKSYAVLLMLVVLGMSCSRSYRALKRDGMLPEVSEMKARPVFDLTDSDGDGIIDMLDGRSEAPFEANRKIIYDGFLVLLVRDADSTATSILELTRSFEGYPLDISTDELKIRIPKDRIDEAMDRMAELGKLRRRRLRGRDVTTRYTDLELRLDNARRARDRYLELLDQATEVEDLLAVERELERVQGNIESMEGSLKSLTEETTYATLTITLQERTKLGPLGAIGKGLYEAVRWLFVWN